MLEGLADAMAEKGYVGTSVSDIISRAGVSRETFYQQYASKQECFMAAFTVAGDLLLTLLVEILERPGPARERLDEALATYIDGIIEHDTFARLFLVEVYAAGPEALARRGEFQHLIASGLAELLGRAQDEEALLACDLFIAGLASIVTMPLVTGDHDRLRALRSPMVDLVLHQFGEDG